MFKLPVIKEQVNYDLEGIFNNKNSLRTNSVPGMVACVGNAKLDVISMVSGV